MQIFKGVVRTPDGQNDGSRSDFVPQGIRRATLCTCSDSFLTRRTV